MRTESAGGSCADSIVSALTSLGSHTLFGVMGRANLPLVDAWVRSGHDYIPARHENGAVAMADAWARTTSPPGLVTVTRGPGLTNAITAICEAGRARSPVLVLTGDAPSGARAGDQPVDRAALFAALGIECVVLCRTDHIDRDLQVAVDRCLGGRQPVAVVMPADVLRQPGPTVRLLEPTVRHPVPSSAALAEAGRALSGSARPAIVVGRGYEGDEQLVRHVADRIGAVVATTMHTTGTLAGYRYSIGTAGVHGSELATELLGAADVLLVLGASLNRFTTRAGHLFPSVRRTIRVDIDPCVARSDRESVLVGDAAEILARLCDHIGDRPPGAGFHQDTTAERIAAFQRPLPQEASSASGRTETPEVLLSLLDRVLPDDRALVCEPGHGTGHALQRLSVTQPRRTAHPFFFESIGLGVGMAVGLAVARRPTVTVLVTGDGALAMSCGELDTLRRVDLPILVVVLNDAAYGAEAREIEMSAGDVGLAAFPDVDFAAIADSLGIPGTTVRTSSDLVAVADRLRQPSGPMLLDVKVELGPAPWFAAAAGPDGYLRAPAQGV